VRTTGLFLFSQHFRRTGEPRTELVAYLDAAVHESAIGTELPIWDVRYSVAIGGEADMHRARQNRRE
jgi:hypothetical protein